MIVVKSPVFGTLALCYAESGAVVETGVELGEVESMKTFFRFYAPAQGTVKWLAGLGEVIGEGDPLVEIK